MEIAPEHDFDFAIELVQCCRAGLCRRFGVLTNGDFGRVVLFKKALIKYAEDSIGRYLGRRYITAPRAYPHSDSLVLVQSALPPRDIIQNFIARGFAQSIL